MATVTTVRSKKAMSSGEGVDKKGGKEQRKGKGTGRKDQAQKHMHAAHMLCREEQ